MGNSIQDRINKCRTDADFYEGLLNTYPDLEIHRDRWNHERLVSKSVNGLVDEVCIIGSCGCCADAPLDAWCYIKDPKTGTKIYSSPPSVCVGNKEYDGSWRTDDVRPLLRKHGLTNPDLLVAITREIGERDALFREDESEEEGA